MANVPIQDSSMEIFSGQHFCVCLFYWVAIALDVDRGAIGYNEEI
ncbi:MULTISPECIES: hypothetical protein [Spirulina sp. CCY15215]|nr:hypothetical protein [Spirulina major]